MERRYKAISLWACEWCRQNRTIRSILVYSRNNLRRFKSPREVYVIRSAFCVFGVYCFLLFVYLAGFWIFFFFGRLFIFVIFFINSHKFEPSTYLTTEREKAQIRMKFVMKFKQTCMWNLISYELFKHRICSLFRYFKETGTMTTL